MKKKKKKRNKSRTVDDQTETREKEMVQEKVEFLFRVVESRKIRTG